MRGRGAARVRADPPLLRQALPPRLERSVPGIELRSRAPADGALERRDRSGVEQVAAGRVRGTRVGERPRAGADLVAGELAVRGRHGQLRLIHPRAARPGEGEVAARVVLPGDDPDDELRVDRGGRGRVTRPGRPGPVHFIGGGLVQARQPAGHLVHVNGQQDGAARLPGDYQGRLPPGDAEVRPDVDVEDLGASPVILGGETGPGPAEGDAGQRLVSPRVVVTRGDDEGVPGACRGQGDRDGIGVRRAGGMLNEADGHGSPPGVRARLNTGAGTPGRRSRTRPPRRRWSARTGSGPPRT
jgi:hypothetical protein